MHKEENSIWYPLYFISVGFNIVHLPLSNSSRILSKLKVQYLIHHFKLSQWCDIKSSIDKRSNSQEPNGHVAKSQSFQELHCTNISKGLFILFYFVLFMHLISSITVQTNNCLHYIATDVLAVLKDCYKQWFFFNLVNTQGDIEKQTSPKFECLQMWGHLYRRRH